MKSLEIKNLSFSYNNVPVLKNIDFSAEEGEFVTVIGPNGSGKSTLLKCICNILDCKGVYIFGRKKEKYSPKELAKHVAYVSQNNDENIYFTVFQFLLMSRYAYTGTFSSLSASDYSACEKALEITGTQKYRNRIMKFLSGGERQKIFIASAVAQEADIMLFDEPATYLDPRHVKETMDILKKIRATVIMVTHDLGSVFMGNRLVALKDGEKVFDDSPHVFFEKHSAEKIFDTDFIYIEENNRKYILQK